VNYRNAEMRNTYVIRWKSLASGRAGKGSKLFSREEAEQLAEELNLEYPQIQHEAINTLQPAEAQPPSEPIPLLSAA
jgi:hypothetical protein